MCENIVGQRIKERREKLGLSAIDVSLLTNMSRGSIYRYETDRAENITVKSLVPLAVVLKTTPDYLMGWTDYPEIIERNISYDKALDCIRECGWIIYDVEDDAENRCFKMAIEWFNNDKENYIEYIAFKQKNGEDIISAVERSAALFSAEAYAVENYSGRGKYGYSMSIRKLLENGDDFKYRLEKLAYRLRRLNLPMLDLDWYRQNRKEFNSFYEECITYKSVDDFITSPSEAHYKAVMKCTHLIHDRYSGNMEISKISNLLAKRIAEGDFTLQELLETEPAEIFKTIKKELQINSSTEENNNGIS